MKIIVRQLYFLLFCVIFVSSSYAQIFNGGPKIQGPWLWMISPTNVGDVVLRGASAAASGIDFLSIASGGAVTEQRIATEGAIISDSIGNKAWTLGSLRPERGDNVNEMLNTIGLAEGDMSGHVAYGSILINAFEEQDTLMFVGSDDAVKVWLNGEVVHENFVDRSARDYQDVFIVTLKKGKNVLLVAVYEAGGAWSGFFGFELGIEYEILPPRGLSIDVNEDGKTNTADLAIVLVSITLDNIAKKNPLADVNKDGVVNIADLQLVIDYLDDPITGAAPRLQNTVSHPKRKLATAWAKLKMR